MKLISIKVSEKAYSEIKEYAQHRGRPVAEVIREAMDYYIDNHVQPVRKLHKMPTVSGPKLRKRWTKEEVEAELFE